MKKQCLNSYSISEGLNNPNSQNPTDDNKLGEADIMEWRTIPKFEKYEISDEMEIRNRHGKILKQKPDGTISLYKADGKHTYISVEKTYNEVFPEYKERKPLKTLTAKDEDVLVPDREPERYNVLSTLAAKIVGNGHNELVINGNIYPPLWYKPAYKSGGKEEIIYKGMSYDDLIQEALLYMYELITTIHPESPLPVQYVAVSVRNRFLDMYKDPDGLEYSTGLERTDSDGETFSLLDIYEPEYEELDLGVSDSITEKLLWLKSILNQQDYEIIYYYYGHELTMEQIAKITGLTRQTVSGRIKRILAKVQKKLGKDR